MEQLPSMLPELREGIEDGTITAVADKIAQASEIHQSHQICSRGKWTWCAKCGAFTAFGNRPQRLMVPCAPPTKAGKDALSRIKKGRPPENKDKDWGDE